MASLPHIEDGPVCWCNPIFLVNCTECDPREKDRPSCKRCNDSTLVRGEYVDGSVAVHFDIEEEN